MRKTLLRTLKTSIIAGALAVGGTANAADLGGFPQESFKDAAPIFSWAGFYGGLNAGFGVGDTDGSALSDPTGGIFGTPFIANYGDTIQGPMGGGQIGWLGQSGTFVYGLEATFDWTDIDGSTNCGLGGFGVIQTNCEQEVSWFGTVVGRLGFAAGRSLFYVNGGWAYGRVKNDMNANCVIACGAVGPAGTSIASASTKKTHTSGWTLGAGIEHAFTNNFSVGVEYAHIDLGDDTQIVAINANPALGLPASSVTSRSDVEFDTIKLRANWRFNTTGFGF